MAAMMKKDAQKQSSGSWWEIILVMVVSLAAGLMDARLKSVGILLPAAYMIIEGKLRHRKWSEMGFRFKNTPADLLHNLGWVLLVGVGTQAVVLWGTKILSPDFHNQVIAHIIGRTPINLSSINAGLILSLLLAALGEEIIFRGLFQKRTAAFLPGWVAIGLTSAVFALMHFSTGPTAVMLFDLATILLDSILYGIIFARTDNVFASWTAHFLANFVAVILLAVMPI